MGKTILRRFIELTMGSMQKHAWYPDEGCYVIWYGKHVEDVIMSDWSTTAPEEGSIQWKCVAAGNDIIMPGSAKDAQSIREAYRDGRLSEQDICECAGRVLSLVERLEKTRLRLRR